MADALAPLSFLNRVGDGPGARYSNTAETSAFLDKHRCNCIPRTRGQSAIITSLAPQLEPT